MQAAAINIALLILAGLCLLGAVAFALRAVRARSSIARQPYNVGLQETQQSVQVNLIRAFIALILGLLLLGVFGIRPREATPTEPATEPTLVAPATAPPVAATPTTGSVIVPLETAGPGETPTTSPATPTAEPTLTPVPQPTTATVSSGVGVWLRSSPSTSGEQLEWLLDGTVVNLLPGEETGDDLLWRQVQTIEGLEGWVAADFLIVSAP